MTDNIVGVLHTTKPNNVYFIIFDLNFFFFKENCLLFHTFFVVDLIVAH